MSETATYAQRCKITSRSRPGVQRRLTREHGSDGRRLARAFKTFAVLKKQNMFSSWTTNFKDTLLSNARRAQVGLLAKHVTGQHKLQDFRTFLMKNPRVEFSQEREGERDIDRARERGRQWKPHVYTSQRNFFPTAGREVSSEQALYYLTFCKGQRNNNL